MEQNSDLEPKKVKNRGSGAGGSNTNKSGLGFEKSTNIAENLFVMAIKVILKEQIKNYIYVVKIINLYINK